jgi:hypothetical protein
VQSDQASLDVLSRPSRQTRGLVRSRARYLLLLLKKWMTNDSADYFEDNCEIQGDLTSLKPSLKLYHSGKRAYYNFQVDVVLLFGLTELKAQIAWKEEVSPCDFIETMFDVLT